MDLDIKEGQIWIRVSNLDHYEIISFFITHSTVLDIKLFNITREFYIDKIIDIEDFKREYYLSTECRHDFVPYIGFTEKYEFCKKCNLKR